MKIIFLPLLLFMQILIAQEEILENYIQLGIKNNHAIIQKEFSLQKSISALDEARGSFLPKISINARYSRAGGGRTIDFPVGDLINPVHQGLNSLFGQNIYPANLENVSTPLMRKEEQDTKLTFIQPLFNSDIYYNYQIKSSQVEISSIEKSIYVRSLITDIKTSYYKHLQAIHYKKLLLNTLDLVMENNRVSKSLYRNDKVTEDFVFNSETKINEIEQNILEAEKGIDLTRTYFNFLLNREFDSEIKIENKSRQFENQSENLELSINKAIMNREELKQLSVYQELSNDIISMNKGKYLPNLVFAFDYGFQGDKYKFNKDSDYWRASIVLEWNLFNGLKDEAKIKQSQLEEDIILNKIDELKKRIILQVRNIVKEVKIASKTISTSRLRLKTAQKTFEIINRKFKEGMISQVEYFAAQNSLFQAEINKIQAEYNYEIKVAEWEKLTSIRKLKELGKNRGENEK